MKRGARVTAVCLSLKAADMISEAEPAALKIKIIMATR
jgi:hypothetical protein